MINQTAKWNPHDYDYQTVVKEIIPYIIGGSGADEVLTMLGGPDDRWPDRWHYDLTRFDGFPTVTPNTETAPWSNLDIIFDRDGRVLNVVTE